MARTPSRSRFPGSPTSRPRGRGLRYMVRSSRSPTHGSHACQCKRSPARRMRRSPSPRQTRQWRSIPLASTRSAWTPRAASRTSGTTEAGSSSPRPALSPCPSPSAARTGTRPTQRPTPPSPQTRSPARTAFPTTPRTRPSRPPATARTTSPTAARSSWSSLRSSRSASPTRTQGAGPSTTRIPASTRSSHRIRSTPAHCGGASAAGHRLSPAARASPRWTTAAGSSCGTEPRRLGPARPAASRKASARASDTRTAACARSFSTPRT